MKGAITAIAAISALALQAAGPNENRNDWEIWTPVLTNASPTAFHSRVAGLERITADNAVGDERERTWKATAWRNERVHGQFVVWTKCPANDIRVELSDLVGKGGRIPASALNARFVRYVRASLVNRTKGAVVPEQFVGDCLDTADTTDLGKIDLPANGFRPIWVTAKVPRETVPGIYRGEIAVVADGRRQARFTAEIEVLAETLKDPKDWHFFLDLWQHPWAVARYHCVAPFSEVHFQLMEPLLRELASGGQKTITTTITELPWGHQNFDAYRTMVEHVRNADGSWTHDYTLFDKWVRFAKRCGLGPQIHCYTMATWGGSVYYREAESGRQVKMAMKAGTPEFEEYWGGFLKDLSKHLEANGWLGDTFVALDERSPEELRSSADLLKKYAPSIRIAMAGNRNPSEFKGIEIHNYSSAISRADAAFYAEIGDRVRKGHTTTFYICCGPDHPNTFMTSPLAESRWLGLFAAAKGYDGMLRWAAFNWNRDPLLDSTYASRNGEGGWKPGDLYLLYPNGRASTRWEMLRDSIENYEKIRQLRAAGKATAELEEAVGALKFEGCGGRKPADWDRETDRIEAAIVAASER